MREKFHEISHNIGEQKEALTFCCKPSSLVAIACHQILQEIIEQGQQATERANIHKDMRSQEIHPEFPD